MGSLHLAFITVASCAWLLLPTSLLAADDQAPTAERELDNSIVSLLMEKTSIVVIGEPVYPSYYAKHPRAALRERLPFQLKVHRILRSKSPEDAAVIKPGQTIKVTVQRDSVDFRFKEGEPAIFFLKPDENRNKLRSTNPLYDREWRLVADYFAVQPYSRDLENVIVMFKEKE